LVNRALNRVDEKFRRHDGGNEKTRRRIKKPNPRLFPHICQVSEIPCHEIINFVKRRESDVKRVGDKFPVKNSA
jgi:hypothetical protein